MNINNIIPPIAEDEVWRTVVIDGVSYDRYMVSTYGRVISLNYANTGEMKLLKLSINNNGYLKVTLSYNTISKGYMVHRIVAETFDDMIPTDDDTLKECVRHKDGNHYNNHISNLYWISYEQALQPKKKRVE